MPVNRQFDFMLADRGYMLPRGPMKGRAWRRSGQSDAPSSRSAEAAKYGQLPDELDHPEVWDDWSAGFGDAYRRPEAPNRVHWSENFDLRFPRQAVHCQEVGRVGIASGATDVDGFLPLPDQNDLGRIGAGKVLILGRQFRQSAYPVSQSTYSFNFGAATVSYAGRPATFGSYVYIPTAEITQFTRLDYADAEVGASHGMPARAFAVAGNRLWRAHGPANGRYYLQSVAAGADPTVTGNWSATLTVGRGQGDIADMVALEDQLYVGMADGLYAGDQSGSFFQVINLEMQPHIDNFRDLVVHNGAIIAPHVGGVLKYETNGLVAEVTEIGPSMLSNRSPVRGHVRALRSFGPWLYAGLYTGSQSYILAGHEQGRGAPWSWTVMQRLPHTVRVHRIYFDGITWTKNGPTQLPARCWIATDASVDTGGTSAYYAFPVPAMNDNPLNAESPFSPLYVGSARMDMGAVDWGAPGTPKVFRSVEVWADNLLAGNRYADVYYTVDTGSRILLGRAETSPKTVLYFPNGTGTFVTGQSIALSLESFTNNQTITPIYRALVLRGALRPKSADLITAQVRIADGIRDRRGTPMRSGATMLQELRDMAATVAPQQLVDVAGAVNWVNVLAPIGEQEVYQEGDENPEIAAEIRMAVLTFSGS